MLDPSHISDLAFKLLNTGTVIGQPSTVKDFIDPCQQALAVANVGASNMQLLCESWRTAKDGQII
jgi:hypothetical protein